MVCPFCNLNMKKGKLLGNQVKLKWIPDGQKVSSFGFIIYNNEIILKNSGGWGRPYTVAYVCRKCNKLITNI